MNKLIFYLKNSKIFFLAAGLFFIVLGLKIWPNYEKDEPVMCYKRQERNIPFKVIGVLQTQNHDMDGRIIYPDIQIYRDVQPEDFYKNFELNTFIKLNGKIPTADFSKIVIGIVLYNTPNNVLGVDVKRVYEFIKYPDCFDCYDKCNEVLVGMDIYVEKGVDENLFPATVILIQIDPPKEWDRKNISIHPNICKPDKL